jgi:signal transduction histidine kinase
VGNDFANAEPNFALFLVAMGCYLGSAAIIERRPPAREYADRRQPLWAILVPYLVAGLTVGLITYELRRATLEPGEVLLLAIALAMVAVVIARQVVALRDYRHLVEDRRRALVSSVSHELRTPLTAMVGFLDVMKDPDVALGDTERQELTEVVHQQAVYMSRIVADLLLLARDSAGPELRESIISLDKVTADSVWSGRFSPAGLEVEIEPGLFAYLDPDRTRQVIENLVSNAVRYGNGQVLVLLASRGSDLTIEVHDDGPGVPRKYEVVIWEQFERGPNRLNSNVPGSGIGLAVVDRIVRRHGGQVAYERSRRLGGACFRVVFTNRLRSAPQMNESLQAPVPAR